MRFGVVWFIAITVINASGAFVSAARGADEIDVRDAVKRIREGLIGAMRDLPADATTASQNEARRNAAEKVRALANGWKLRAEFTVKDVEFVRPDLSAIIVKVEDVGEGAAAENVIIAKIPVDLGRSIRKGGQIRVTGQAVLRVLPLDKISPGIVHDSPAARTQIAFSADPRPGGGHMAQAPGTWPGWILSISDPTVEVLGVESTVKQSATTKSDAPTKDASKKDVSPTGTNPKRRDMAEIAREIGDALKDANAKGGTTVVKRSAVQDAERKLVADVAALESVTLLVRVIDVTSTKPAGDKTRCIIVIDRHNELPSGAVYGSQITATLSAADAAIATAGPCTVRITGKPALNFHALAPHKTGNPDRPHGTVVLRSSFDSRDKWELMLTDEADSVEKIEK